MTNAISFEQFVGKKRKRPEQICVKCGKQKEIYTLPRVQGDFHRC